MIKKLFNFFRHDPMPAEYIIPSPPPTNVDAEAHQPQWIPPGVSVTLHKHNIVLTDGMVYVGKKNKQNVSTFSYPSLIDPDLAISNTAPNTLSAYALSYGSSRYKTLDPSHRKAYLMWLADGRKNLQVPIDYVFIFFYGLEQRVLIDAAQQAISPDEMHCIAHEISRLLSLYTHYLFQHHAVQLLDYLGTQLVNPTLYLQAPPDIIADNCWTLPILIKIALGQAAVAKVPLPADWACVWALFDPNIRRRIAVHRCRQRFTALFKKVYQQHYGHGLKLKISKKKLLIIYEPMSPDPAFRRYIRPALDLPDITRLKTPIVQLQAIVDECANMLSAYSSYVGKYPEQANSLTALFLLPPHAWPPEAIAQLTSLRETIGDTLTTLTLSDLLSQLKQSASLPRQKIMLLMQALNTLQIGVEPDGYFSHHTPKIDDTITLFAIMADDSTPPRSSEHYQVALTTLNLASGLLLEGQHAASAITDKLAPYIESWSDLKPHHTRLRAHLQLALTCPLPRPILKKYIAPFSLATRQAIAAFLAYLTQSHCRIGPETLQSLTRRYTLLNVDTQLMYADLHAHTSTPSRHPFASPQVASNTPSSFSLDNTRIAQLQQETARVSALLTPLFLDDTSHGTPFDFVPTIQQNEAPSATLLALEDELSAFVHRLITQTTWSRSDITTLANSLDIMLDGALERINEAAFDHYDAPLVEGEDPFEINPDIVKQLQT